VAPPVSLVPDVVAMGEMPVGEPRTQVVSVASRTGEPLTVVIEGRPDEVSVRVDERSRVTLALTVVLKRPGIWRGTVKGQVRHGDRRVPIEIPCVAYGKAN